jgi:DNA-binding MarR family transcriptional regulator/N-acetylglutamate synthase-like GNAT family acetyltransferase
MTDAGLAQRVAAVRRFNRFYTRRIGVLRAGLGGTAFSLAESRLLYELAHGGERTAAALARGLALDAGYLSRLLRGLRRRGLVAGRTSPEDARQSLLAVTRKGREATAQLEACMRAEVGALLAPLGDAAQGELVEAMRAIERLLDGDARARGLIVLRPHRAGDMGWVVERHGALYAAEFGYDQTFEALVAEIVARFVREFEPRRERCWIAERDGVRLGSVFLVKASRAEAKLRLLIVEPSARGLGIGKRLVEECVRFARAAGYRKLTLWTQSHLEAARRIYERAGFRRVREEPHASFGKRLVGEYWELRL